MPPPSLTPLPGMPGSRVPEVGTVVGCAAELPPRVPNSFLGHVQASLLLQNCKKYHGWGLSWGGGKSASEDRNLALVFADSSRSGQSQEQGNQRREVCKWSKIKIHFSPSPLGNTVDFQTRIWNRVFPSKMVKPQSKLERAAIDGIFTLRSR